MVKAFLSHTSSDKDLVGLVHKKLSKKNAWYDAANIENGESIPEKINEGLRNATHYVLFWSKQASESVWVQVELNAAFVRLLANKCRFIIFTLDDTLLPELLQPYKYDKIDKTNLDAAASKIVEIILSQEGAESKLSEFVNRTKEIGQIEELARSGYKFIILNGILGIGKSSLAEKALQWLYPNIASKRMIIDFSSIPGVAELIIELSRKAKVSAPYENNDSESQKNNIRFLLETISSTKTLLILKDIKKWLNDDGTLNTDLRFFIDIIISTDMFEGITIATSSRYVELPIEYCETSYQITVKGMSDVHIASIIQNNLLSTFEEYDDKKTYEFATKLYGYPLGAKLGAYYISNNGYEYYLKQPQKIQSLKVSLAKQLVQYANISEACENYLKIVSLAQSKLRNEEYADAFPALKSQIAILSDEAFFAGILKFDDDGCYKLEPIVEDYYYDLAFNANNRKELCISLEKYLLNALKDASGDKYFRLIPVAIHILVLTGNISEAQKLQAELTATMIETMWDQYNHAEYEDALATANSLLSANSEDTESLYVKALCLTRFDRYTEAETLLNNLLDNDTSNESRYYYALGRIQKRQGKYEKAIELFKIATLKKSRYLSPWREIAECYIYVNQLSNAQNAIEKAKHIDDSNIFVTLLEALLFQKVGNAEKSVEILSDPSLFGQNNAQVLFRKGRAYDQLGNTVKACECYNDALKQNSKMYDAKLCLLSHQILDDPNIAASSIEELKPNLYGKRKAILTNIEARLVGYVNHHEMEAIELLESVKPIFRDTQWYAVKIQLLEKIIEKNLSVGRELLAQESQKELTSLHADFENKFGKSIVSESDLLPDA